MGNSADKNKHYEIRIKVVSKTLHDELISIAKHHSVCVSSFLKPKIREIVDSYPDRIRKPIE
jgi:hypothetical protein